MVDDGSGSDIYIPSMLLRKNDGDKLKATLKNNTGILMELAFGFSQDERVKYQVWTTPTDPVSRQFLSSFSKVAQAFGNHAAFQPRQYFHSGKRYLNCGSGGDQVSCNELCTNNGRYCATGQPHLNITGAAVIVESLRRICIWEKYGQADQIGAAWWKYVEAFEQHCHPNLFTDSSCIENSYKEAGIDAAAIHGCIDDSGGTTNDATNSKLDQELQDKVEHGVPYHPSAYIDRLPLDHSPTSFTLFQSLCMSLAFDTTPDVCHSCGWCFDTVGCIELGSCEAARKQRKKQQAKHDSKSKHHYFLKMCFTFLLVGLSGYAVVLIHRQIQHERQRRSTGYTHLATGEQQGDGAIRAMPLMSSNLGESS